MISYSILVVDDEKVIRDGLALVLGKRYGVKTFPRAEPALEFMKSHPPDLVLLDIWLPGMSGLEALNEMRQLCPDVLIIMITAHEEIRSVVSAMRRGAYDYIVKPLNIDGLIRNIEKALNSIRIRKEIQELQEKFLKENLPCIIGESNAIQEVMEVVRKVAKSTDTPVLILGETGTGKELVAGAVHYRSPYFSGPMVPVNCAAIPKELIESELFGYEKGAFSGAHVSGKTGLVERRGGTLFLDEVGDLSLEAQAKLLRFLEEGEFYRVGGTRKRQVKTRVISATNRNLDQMVISGAFRQDLYYRLAVIKIQVPSLNERPEDIVPLSRHFLQEFSKKFGKSFMGISADCEMALSSLPWKGNIRELRNVIERAVLIGEGPELTLSDIGGRQADQKDREIPFPALTKNGIDLPFLLESLERHYIRESLTLVNQNESKAANLLHLSRDAFRYRKRRLQIH